MANVLNQGIKEVTAGDIARAFMVWTLDATPEAATAARVTWELIDENGRVYAKGNGEAVEANPNPTRPGKWNFKCYSTIQIPGNIPVNTSGTTYQIVWSLNIGGTSAVAFDTFTVNSPEFGELGSVDSVDLYTESTTVQIILPFQASEVKLTVNRSNDAILNRVVTKDPLQTTQGWLYEVDLSPSDIPGNAASLEPLGLIWRYKENNTKPQSVENSSLYLVNSTIMSAMKDVESFVNRVYIESGITPGTIFTPVDLARHLRRGMDQFNTYIRPTNFTMTNAKGALRQLWIMNAIIDACRSMYLYEGMKQFDFQGQSVSLSVDRTQFWSQMAQEMQSENDTYIKQLKDNLAKWGIFGGDGNVVGPRPGAVGQIGISLSPLTPLRQSYYRYLGQATQVGF